MGCPLCPFNVSVDASVSQFQIKHLFHYYYMFFLTCKLENELAYVHVIMVTNFRFYPQEREKMHIQTNVLHSYKTFFMFLIKPGDIKLDFLLYI